MTDKMLQFKALLATGAAALTALWGWFGWAVVIWVGLMLTDWLVGSAIASKEGRWSSAKLRDGAWHKAGMILTFLIALIADWMIGMTLEHLPMVHLPFTYTVLLSPLVVVWYIVGELGSLAEHAAATGAPVPAWLLHILEASREAVDAAGNAVHDTVDQQETTEKSPENKNIPELPGEKKG